MFNLTKSGKFQLDVRKLDKLRREQLSFEVLSLLKKFQYDNLSVTLGIYCSDLRPSKNLSL